ncbi:MULTISPECIES: phage major tail protein, TP901-1 family [Iodidimonas]|uniref:Phage major tail protein, TP901-1 family n=1 Tax=Iodidimonas nitroreducens TaxID=1236968 RepID=A0A5A7NDP4_9PROT|nr:MULTISPECIES: phage major tail protein, TP901-1 family [Iodidimonas]GAK34416.1 phage major tail protein, TP901-1 family [alpha proteobacterium Q-1]GER05046.1 phage major tail protein, TP901-1 family [Iodidimonas nitroreducens]
MTAESGRGFLVKISNGETPPVFSTLAGLRSTSLSINSTAVDITNKDSGGWRELLGGAGVRRLTLSGSGVFTNSAAESILRSQALTGSVSAYQVIFENGEQFTGQFQITALDYSGDHNGERTYSLSMESSGPISFTVAP